MNELWTHQARALELAKHKNEFALFFEPGTGKTRTAIEIINHKFAKEGRFLKTLVLCPLSVTSVWNNELLANGFVSDQLVIPNVSGAKRKNYLHDRLWDSGCSPGYKNKKIVVLNYEAIILNDIFDIVKAWKPEVLICDESHRLKSHDSKRSKVTHMLAMDAKYRYILSGTPILKDAGDLYQQFKILDNGDTFGTNYWAFKNRYFWDKNSSWKSSQNYFPKYEIRPEALREITSKIAPRSMSVRKEDALDLPPLIRQTINVEMSKEQVRVYEDMRKEMISFLNAEENNAAVATIALTKALRFQQIVSGFVTGTTGPYLFKENPRLRVLKDLLMDLTPGHKVIVWSNFRENYKMIRGICEELDIGSVELHGETSQGDRACNLKEFQENPEVRVMIANQHSGGIGVSMTAASYMIYYSKGFSLEDDIQSEARAHRGGSEQHTKITRIDLTCPATIDEAVNISLYNKQAIGLSILQELKK